MDNEALRVEITHGDRNTVVAVTGEIDADSMLALQAPLSELSPESQIILDMSGVRFMDSSGLKVILTQRIRMTEPSGSIHIRTAYPKNKPLTKINVYSGFYSEPDGDSATWWSTRVDRA